MDLASITSENFKRSGKIKRELSSLAFSNSAVKFGQTQNVQNIRRIP